MPNPEQLSNEAEKSPQKPFQNGIQGLDKLDLLQAPAKAPEGTLPQKVLRSIGRKIDNRQTKISNILDDLSTVSTSEQLLALIQDEKKLEEVTTLLSEQAGIVERESQGHFDPLPFKQKIATVENLSRELWAKLRADSVLDIKNEIEKFKQAIATEKSAPEEEGKEDSRERMVDELIESGMKDPSVLQKISEKHAMWARQQPPIREKPQAEQKSESRELFTFDDVQTVDDLLRFLRQGQNLELEILTSDGLRWFKGREWADIIRQRLGEFEQARAKGRKDIEKQIEAFVTSPINFETREAMRRAFVVQGLLSSKSAQPLRQESQERITPVGDKEKIPNNTPKEEPSFGAATNEFLAELQRGIIQTKRDAERDTELGVAYAELVRKFQYFGSADFKKKDVQGRKEEVEQFISTLPTNLREKLKKVVEADKIVEGTPPSVLKSPAQLSATSPAEPLTPKTVEKLNAEELLEQIIADVAATPTFSRGHGEKTISVAGRDIARGIRRLVKDFKKGEFRALPREEQTREIQDAIDMLTSHAQLRADLRDAFRELGLLEGKREKTKTAEASPVVSALNPRKTFNQPPAAPFTAPTTPKSPERQKTPEAGKAEALNEYFGKVESGTDLWNKINDLPRSATLLGSNFDLSELEQLSSELSQKVIDFLGVIEMWEKDKKSAKEMAKSRDDFISSEKIPSGCQTAFRTIANFAIRKILGASVEKLKASPQTASDASAPKAPPTGGATEGTPTESIRKGLSSTDFLAHAAAKKAAEARKAPSEVTTRASTSESPQPSTAPGGETPKETPKEAEPQSLAEKLGFRSRLWNPKRKSTPETASTASPKAETVPSAPSPKAETPPATSTPEATETASPEKPKLSAEVQPEVLTFEQVLQLKLEDLREILKSTTMDVVSAALTDMSPKLVKQTREALTEEDKVRFDRLYSLELLNTPIIVDPARKKIIEIAQARLETPTSPEKTSDAPTAPEKIS